MRALPRLVAALFLVAVVGVPLHAQSLKIADAAASAQSAPAASLKTATTWYLAIMSADWASTAYDEVATSVPERDPLFNWAHSPLAQASLGVAVDATVLLTTTQVIAPRHPTLAKALLYGISAARYIVVLDNVVTGLNGRPKH